MHAAIDAAAAAEAGRGDNQGTEAAEAGAGDNQGTAALPEVRRDLKDASSPLYLPYISPMSPLYLPISPYISLYLP